MDNFTRFLAKNAGMSFPDAGGAGGGAGAGGGDGGASGSSRTSKTKNRGSRAGSKGGAKNKALWLLGDSGEARYIIKGFTQINARNVVLK